MRKLGMIIITLFLALPIALCALAASAADIPSSASGTYHGAAGTTAGWDCEVRAYQISDGGITNRVLSADCETPGVHREGTISTYDACVTSALQPPLRPWGQAAQYPGVPKFSIVSYSPATAQCALGEIRVQITTATANPTAPGTPGPESVMCRTQIVLPATPYPGCAAPAVPPKPMSGNAWRCRYFGTYCGR